jgi:CO dehydrogenase/acetyl-CoA synthase delta subunit
MNDQLELDFGDEHSLYYRMDKRALIERAQQLEAMFTSSVRSTALHGEINRAVLQVWKTLDKVGVPTDPKQEAVYYGIQYAVSKIKELNHES